MAAIVIHKWAPTHGIHFIPRLPPRGLCPLLVRSQVPSPLSGHLQKGSQISEGARWVNFVARHTHLYKEPDHLEGPEVQGVLDFGLGAQAQAPHPSPLSCLVMTLLSPFFYTCVWRLSRLSLDSLHSQGFSPPPCQ